MSSEEFGARMTIKALPSTRTRTVRIKQTRKPQPNDDIDWQAEPLPATASS